MTRLAHVRARARSERVPPPVARVVDARRRLVEGIATDLVGAGDVGPTHARIWARSHGHGPHELVVVDEETETTVAEATIGVPDDPRSDGTVGIDVPGDLEGAPALRPRRRYRFSLTCRADGRLVGHGRFQTAPAPDDVPETVRFALVSCHQPFGTDGALRPKSLDLVRRAAPLLASLDVERVLMVGDQIYSDAPRGLGLFDPEYFALVAPPGRPDIFSCSREQVRALFQERHRTFWKVPGFQALMREFPSDMILDDHEVVDNFGSHPAHASDRYAALRGGAIDAFFDYQALRAFRRRGAAPPQNFSHSIEHGPVAVFVFDLRSERHAGEEETTLYGLGQLTSFCAFLARNRHKRAILVVLSVPLLHVPAWLASAGAHLGGEASDAADRWSNPKATLARDVLLQTLFDHQRDNPEQRLVLLSGDIHLGMVARFDWDDHSLPPLHQFVSSALSNRYSPLLQHLAMLVPKVTWLTAEHGRAIARASLLDNAGGHGKNPCAELNLGVVDVVSHPRETLLRMRLFGVRDDVTVTLFDSGLL